MKNCLKITLNQENTANWSITSNWTWSRRLIGLDFTEIFADLYNNITLYIIKIDITIIHYWKMIRWGTGKGKN